MLDTPGVVRAGGMKARTDAPRPPVVAPTRPWGPHRSFFFSTPRKKGEVENVGANNTILGGRYKVPTPVTPTDLPLVLRFFLLPAPEAEGLVDVTGDPVFCSRPESLEVWLDSVDSDLALFRDSAANLTDFFLAMVKLYTTDTTHEERGEEGGRERKRGPEQDLLNWIFPSIFF